MIALISVLLLAVTASAQTNNNALPPWTQGPFTFYGAGNNMYAGSHCLDGSGSGSIFVTGYTDGTLLGQSPQMGGGEDWWIAKFNKNAGFLTVNSSNPTLRFIMSPNNDFGTTCASDTAGAVYVGGGTQGQLNNVTRTNTNWDSVVAKYDAQMNRVWITQFSVATEDYVTHLVLSGNTLYAVGWNEVTGGWPVVWIHALDPTSGALLWNRAVQYGTSGTYTFAAGVTINLLTNDLMIVGKYSTGSLPGLMNSTGSVPPALPAAGSYSNGFIASFTPSGVFNWHRAIDAPRSDMVVSVVTDVSGALYVGGYVTGRVNDADYIPTSALNPLPFFAKYSADGSHQWTNILPQVDSWSIGQVLVDGLGGVYGVRQHTNCWDIGSQRALVGKIRDCNNNNGQQETMLIKANSANGAIQYVQPLGNGVYNTVTLDREAVLTIGGQFLGAANNQLHGTFAPTNVWYTFVDTMQLNYSCQCSEITSVVNEMVQLLRLE